MKERVRTRRAPDTVIFLEAVGMRDGVALLSDCRDVRQCVM